MWTVPSHTNTGHRFGASLAAAPAEGVVVGNPKCQGQALRPVVLKVGLPEDPLEAWLKRR